ncbi:hypothetical protein P7D22_15925, partial [Lichenihabitans sp. Uapishka_5]|uniref:hypothetical protein n=1 Tax=Lichenihabitans sp. Uapishka_5 TaxID=3037302 RepID=UPI0029E7F855
VQELGPFFGLGLIAARWGLAAWLAVAALGAARRGNLQPACYAGLVLPLLAVHDVTLQNSMIGIAWFAIGIMAAALRLESVPAAVLPAAAPRRPWEVPACA